MNDEKLAEEIAADTFQVDPKSPEYVRVAEEPTGTDLVIPDPGDAHGVMAVLDKHDEAMIVQELQRRVLRVMLYTFPLEGKEVTDLSYLGVNEAIRVSCNEYGQRITIVRDSLEVESVEEDLGNGVEQCWQATVYGLNVRTDYGQFGTYIQPKRFKLKAETAATKRRKHEPIAEDNTIADKFARSKAINKAQRNALRVHIPETVRQVLIAQYKGNPEAIRKIEAGAGAASIAALPPPLTDDEAENLKDQCRALYAKLRGINPLAVLPAQFHAYLTRAEGSHQSLQDFLAYLQQRLAEAEQG